MPAAYLFVFVLAALGVASCNTYRVHGAMTYGHIREVSPDEIEHAIAAYHRTHADGPVGQIQVVSRSEVRIYWGDSGCCYSSVERKGTHWEFAGDQVLWTE
jgi:hypothetical protein